MSNNLTPVEQQIGLSPEVFNNLKTYDDFVGFYIQLEQVSSGFSWMKADLLVEMDKKLGDSSLRELGKSLRQPYSTTTNYIRAARAFPPEKRDVGASFSLHFQASFADSYDEKSKSFKTDERFKWLEEAIDNNYSTRQLAEMIQEKKQNILVEGGDEQAERKQEVKKIVQQINSALVAISKKSIDDDNAFKQLQAIKEAIYG